RLALLALLSAAGGCLFPTSHDFCPSGAVGLQIELLGETNNSDHLSVQVTLDNQTTPLVREFTRAIGAAKETLEIDLRDYEADKYHHLAVVVVARLRGQKVGGGSKKVQIQGGCTA